MKNLFLLPESFKALDDYRYRQCQVGNFQLVLYILIMSVASILNYLHGNYTVTIIQTALVVISISSLILLRRDGRIELALNLATMVLFTLIITLLIYGNEASYMFISLYPISCLILLGLERGLISSVLFFMVVLCVTFMKIGFVIEGLEFVLLFNSVVVLGISIGATYYAEYTKEGILEKIKHLSQIDQLTGLWNRKKFDEVMEEKLKIYMEEKVPFAIMVIDVDYFKSINDQYGHRVGDEVLVEVAQKLKTAIGKEEVLTRWGGEEFVVVMPKAGRVEVEKKANEIVEYIEEEEFKWVGKLTVSVGCGSIEQGDFFKVEDFFRVVDRVLYDAKEKGRNQWCSI